MESTPRTDCWGRSRSTEITCHFKRTHGHNSRVAQDIQYPECTSSRFKGAIPGAWYFWKKSLVFLEKKPGSSLLRGKSSVSMESMLARKVSLLYSSRGDADRVFFSSRLALLIGFGGLLLIMALAGIDALRVFQRFRQGDEQIRSRYLSQNHVLNDIRSDVYLSGTYVRDYLLEPDSARAAVYRASLEDVRDRKSVV